MESLPVMAKDVLPEWVLEALQELGGAGTPVQVSRVVWRRHESDLRSAGDLYYTWQYDIRWAAQKLRARGDLEPSPKGSKVPWTLSRSPSDPS